MGERGAGPTADGAGPVGHRDGLLERCFAELAEVLFEPAPDGLGPVLDRVVEAGRLVVPAADVVSVTQRQESQAAYTTPAWSDPLAERLDELQYEHDEGPCVTALEEGGMGTAASEDLEHDGTWPRFGPSAAALGAHAVFSVGLFPLSVGRRDPVRGALNLYRTSPGGFDRADREIALMLAAHASTALAYASATAAARRREAQFETALVSRDVIGQAKGILMERRGLEPDDAFAVLRRASQDLNIKLRDVADLLVRRRTEL